MKRILSLLALTAALPAAAQYTQGQVMMNYQQQQPGAQAQMYGGGQMYPGGQQQMMTVPAPPQTLGNPADRPQQSREGEVAADSTPYNSGCGGNMGRLNRDGFVIDGGGGGSHSF